MKDIIWLLIAFGIIMALLSGGAHITIDGVRHDVSWGVAK